MQTNEVGNFVKAALPRLLSDKGQDILGSLGISSEDSEGRLRNTIDIYTDVANAIKDLSEAEQVNVVKGLGGVYHQTRLQTLLDDLGSVDSMYRSMLETAENSEGSAMIENEKYMQSFEARINLLRVELEKLIVVVGEAFLTDGMLAFIQMAGNVLNIIAEITKTFGALPVLLGTGAVALTALSKRFRDLTTAIFTSTKSLFSNDVEIRKLTVSTAKYNALKGMSNSVNIANNATLKTNSAQMAVLSATTQTATVATSKFGNALRGLALATGAGAAFVAVGFVLEKLIGGMGGAIEKSDELASANRILLESYSNNETEIDSLAVKYSELEKEMKKANPDSKKVAEYHDVMNQLGNLLPDLVTGEDQFGNKIIASSTATEIKIGLLKEQLEIQKEINAEQERTDTLDSIDTNSKAIEKAQKKTEDYIKMLTNMLTGVTNRDLSAQYAIEFTDSDGKPLMKSGEDIAKFIDDLKVKLSEATKNGDSKDVSILSSQISQMERYYAMIDKETRGVSKNISMQKSEYIDLISQTVAGSKKMSDSAKNYADSFVASMLKVSDGTNVDSLGEGLNKLLSSDKSSSFVSSLSSEFNKLDTATEDTFSSMSNSVQSFIDNLPQTLIDSGLNDVEIKAIQTALQSMLNSSTADFNSFEDTMKSTGITLDEARRNAEAAGDGMNEMGDDAQKAERDIEKLTDSISYINGVLEDYAESNKLSASTVMELIDKYPQLIAYIGDEGRLVEELTKIRDQDISAAQKQLAEKIEMSEEYYNANLKMIESYFKEHFKFYNGDLTQFQNIAQAKADVEKKLIEYLAKEWSSYYDTISKSFVPVMGKTVDANQPYHLPDGDVSNYPNLDQYTKKANEANRALQNIGKELDKFTVSQVNLDFSTIGTSLEKNSKKASKAAKESTKNAKESIYVSDKYKKALEAINLEIEKQQALQNKFPKYSEDYRKSLQAQIKLEKEKLALISSQQTVLDKQIKSGKIAQTGLIDVSPSSTTKTTTSSQKLNGWSGKTTSGFGMRMHPTLGVYKMHEGIDIAGKKGTRLDSNVNGKVVSQGYNSVSGNFVKIEDSSGFKHFYAHLDKAFVKLGDIVEAGTHIGNIGSTGRSTGAHLHYGVQNKSGKYINPSTYVNSAKNNKVVTSTTSSSNEKSASTIKAETQQAVDQAKSELTSLQADALAAQDRIRDLNANLVQSNLDYYDHLISGANRSIEMSNALASQQLEHTQAYRDELEKENKQHKYKQDLLHKQANFIREQLKRSDLTPSLKSDLTNQLSELKIAWWDVDEAIQSVNEQIENSKIAEFDREIEKLNRTISKSTSLLNLYAKGTKEYNSEQKRVITTLYDKQKAYEAEASALRKLLETEKMSVQARERNMQRLNELSTSWLDIQAEIIDINSSIADDLISTMKESYEQQRDYEIALKESQIEAAQEAYDARIKMLEEESKAYEESVNEQMKALDKSHKDKMDKIAKETKAYEEAVQRQLDLMRNQRDEEDFNKDINKLQKEEAKILEQITTLSMDNSREANLKRKQLEEQLAEVREQIAEKQSDRQFDLREQNLQNELDAYKTQQEAKQELEDNVYNIAKEALDNQLEMYRKELDAKKTLEEEKHKALQKQLERERKDISNHYDNLINNEQQYADLRAQIVNGNVDGMNDKLKSFLENFKNMNKELINELGISWTELENKINRITQAQGSLGNVTTPSLIKDLNTNSGANPTSNSPSTSGGRTLRDEAWDQYLNNKLAWETASASEKAKLSAENEKMRKLWGFQDGAYSKLKGLQKYHSGGIVGGKGNRLTELANKLFNTKPNEQTVIALKRELFTPESNIPNLFSNIKAAIPNFQPQQQQGGIIQIDNLVSIDNVSQNANLDIDRMINQGLDRLVDRMKPYGFKL